MVVLKIRVRLKCATLVMLGLIYVACALDSLVSSNQLNEPSRRFEYPSEFNYTAKRRRQQNTHRTHRHHNSIRRHSNSQLNARDLHQKRTAVLIQKSELQSDYVSAIVGKDVQLDCKLSGLAHDDDKVKLFV